jgi:membrane associated rhomboid family serine protease
VVVVWVLIAACIAVLVRLVSLPDARASIVMLELAVVPSRLSATWLSPQLLTLLTSCFLHAGWVHLAGNTLFLAVFGPPVEARLGWRAFLALYLACGVAGCLAFTLLHPQSAVPLVGASGAIAGVLGAHLALEPRARVTTVVPAFVSVEVASLPAAFVIALWFAFQIASTLAPVTSAGAQTGVAWAAHIAGFAAGVALALPPAVASAWGAASRRAGRRGAAKRTR